MRLVYFGSGEFGLPTLRRLAGRHDIAAVITQPDRPAGRGKRLTPTPIAAFADQAGLSPLKVDSVNVPDVREHIRSLGADAFVVVAFGQKLKRKLLTDMFAINLHGSLLPRWRGAAPVQHAILGGDRETGNSVIALADRMDAGEIYAQSRRSLDPTWTAGDLHDLLAEDGPDLIEQVLADFQAGRLQPQVQDESQVTLAPRLTKEDGWVSFDASAEEAVRRINGLSPWPAVTVQLAETPLKLLRAKIEETAAQQVHEPGSIDAGGIVGCGRGTLRLLEVQPPGKRAMSFADYARGHAIEQGSVLRSERRADSL